MPIEINTILRDLGIAFIVDRDITEIVTRCSLINDDETCPNPNGRDCGSCGDFVADAQQILDLTVVRGSSQFMVPTENGGREWVGFGGGKRISVGVNNGEITLARKDVD
jgi:hypothetical protein